SSYTLLFSSHTLLLFVTLPLPPSSTLFPYTTLFRSYITIIYPYIVAVLLSIAIILLSALLNTAMVVISLLVALLMLGVLPFVLRSEEHTSELQSRFDLVCRLLLEKKNYSCVTKMYTY